MSFETNLLYKQVVQISAALQPLAASVYQTGWAAVWIQWGNAPVTPFHWSQRSQRQLLAFLTFHTCIIGNTRNLKEGRQNILHSGNPQNLHKHFTCSFFFFFLINRTMSSSTEFCYFWSSTQLIQISAWFHAGSKKNKHILLELQANFR